MSDAGGRAGQVLSVAVDQDLCVSSGRCVADAPVVFEFDEDEIARPTGGLGEVRLADLVEIAHNCPAEAITLHGPDGPIALD